MSHLTVLCLSWRSKPARRLADFCFQVKDMTSRLRTTFIDNLKSADWMDYETKQSAKEKVPISQNIIPAKDSHHIIWSLTILSYFYLVLV